MVRKQMSIRELRREGVQALLDRLGPAGTMRFLQDFDAGYGDYTRDRRQWLDGLTVEEIKQEIERRKQAP
jgi:hypothetical protein